MFFKTMVNERKSFLVDEDPITQDKNLVRFSCCPNNDYKEMLSLVESDPGIVNRPSRGSNKTLLHRCIEHHRLCMVEYLLKKDALQLRDAAGNLPLHIAAGIGDTAITEMLIEKGADVNAANNEGDRPLHLASEAGHLTTVQCLLDHGAELGSSGWGGGSPLHAAAEGGDGGVVQALVGRGLDVCGVNDKKETPLHLLAGSPMITNVSAVQLLIEQGADMSAR